MGERKVQNFYMGADYDPARVPKAKRSYLNRCEVRMMMPMSVQCVTCGQFIYAGKKMNAKKEDMVGADYLGIKRVRFIMKCTNCNGHFSIVTDPENMDYAVEHGVTRNYDPRKESTKEAEAAKEQREAEDASDAMKALENRTLDSKRQMEILDALEEIKAMRARQAHLNPDILLSIIFAEEKEREEGGEAEGGAAAGAGGEGSPPPPLTEEDEHLVAATFAARAGLQAVGSVKRLVTAEEGSSAPGKQATAAAAGRVSLPIPAALAAPRLKAPALARKLPPASATAPASSSSSSSSSSAAAPLSASSSLSANTSLQSSGGKRPREAEGEAEQSDSSSTARDGRMSSFGGQGEQEHSHVAGTGGLAGEKKLRLLSSEGPAVTAAGTAAGTASSSVSAATVAPSASLAPRLAASTAQPQSKDQPQQEQQGGSSKPAPVSAPAKGLVAYGSDSDSEGE